MKLNKILYVFAVLCVATASASLWFFITTYHSKVRPPIDSIFFEWGDYGALLAGVCTLAAALFSLATLIYLVSFNLEAQKENRDFIIEQSALISRQMELSELEKYTRHKDLFNERLKHIEKRFGHKFEFLDPFQLYRAAFPNNRIGQTNITNKIDAHSDTPTDLEDAVNGYQILADQVKDYHRLIPRELINFPLSLGMLHDRLQIQYDPNTKIPGDILYDDTTTGINCFKIGEAVRELTYVLNEILEFTGNEPVTTFAHDADASWTQEGLLKYFMSHQPDKPFHIYDPLRSIKALYHIHNHSKELQSHQGHANIYCMWFNIIESKEKLAKLADNNFCKQQGDYIRFNASGFEYSNETELTHQREILKNAHRLIGLN